MTTYTDLIIANMALAHIKQTAIADLTPGSDVQDKVLRWLPEVRMIVLKLFNWKFAIKRATISVDGGTPNHYWAYQHAVPSDSLRIIEVTVEDNGIDYTEEEGYILSQLNDDFDLMYIEDITDPATFTPDFVNGFALLLGSYLAVPIANSEKKEAKLEAKYTKWISAAQRLDFIERRGSYTNKPGSWESIR